MQVIETNDTPRHMIKWYDYSLINHIINGLVYSVKIYCTCGQTIDNGTGHKNYGFAVVIALAGWKHHVHSSNQKAGL